MLALAVMSCRPHRLPSLLLACRSRPFKGKGVSPQRREIVSLLSHDWSFRIVINLELARVQPVSKVIDQCVKEEESLGWSLLLS
jgi:hypothetical protein